jgi:CheY-like chemotaxis protein
LPFRQGAVLSIELSTRSAFPAVALRHTVPGVGPAAIRRKAYWPSRRPGMSVGGELSPSRDFPGARRRPIKREMIDAPTPERSIRIFVADDDPTQRDRVRELLEREGYLAIAVRSGREAIDLVHGVPPPDLLVLAQEMAGYAGSDVLAEMERHARWCRVPAILLTEHPRSLLASVLAAAGQPVLARPVGARELLVHVYRLVGRPEELGDVRAWMAGG